MKLDNKYFQVWQLIMAPRKKMGRIDIYSVISDILTVFSTLLDDLRFLSFQNVPTGTVVISTFPTKVGLFVLDLSKK